MTVGAITRKAGPYTGDGSTATFSFAFRVDSKSDLVVVSYYTATGSTSTLTVDSDFTVSLNSDQESSPGGSITLTAGALAASYTLTIYSDIAETQEVVLTSAGGFYPSVISAELDKLTMLVQDLAAVVARCLKYPASDSISSSDLPSLASRKGQFLVFDATTGNVVGENIVSLSSVTAFSGTLAATSTSGVYTLTDNGNDLPLTVNIVQVTVWDNQALVKNVGYTVSGNKVTFTTLPESGDTLYAQGFYQ